MCSPYQPRAIKCHQVGPLLCGQVRTDDDADVFFAATSSRLSAPDATSQGGTCDAIRELVATAAAMGPWLFSVLAQLHGVADSLEVTPIADARQVVVETGDAVHPAALALLEVAGGSSGMSKDGGGLPVSFIRARAPPSPKTGTPAQKRGCRSDCCNAPAARCQACLRCVPMEAYCEKAQWRAPGCDTLNKTGSSYRHRAGNVTDWR